MRGEKRVRRKEREEKRARGKKSASRKEREPRDVTFMLQIHPKSGNNNFRQSSRHRNRPPSGKGDDDCTFDWLLIPGARGNLTRFGMYLT